MGQYYILVNLDENEYVSAGQYGGGIKLMESPYVGNRFARAASALLADRWAGDRIAYVGDYAWSSARDGSEKDASGADLMRELEEDPWRAVDDGTMRSPTDAVPDDPRPMRYVANLTKDVYYDRDEMPVAFTWTDEHGVGHDTLFDPLLVFLACGNGLGGGDYHADQSYLEVGSWAGDCIQTFDSAGDVAALEKIDCPFDPKA